MVCIDRHFLSLDFICVLHIPAARKSHSLRAGSAHGPVRTAALPLSSQWITVIFAFLAVLHVFFWKQNSNVSLGSSFPSLSACVFWTDLTPWSSPDGHVAQANQWDTPWSIQQRTVLKVSKWPNQANQSQTHAGPGLRLELVGKRKKKKSCSFFSFVIVKLVGIKPKAAHAIYVTVQGGLAPKWSSKKWEERVLQKYISPELLNPSLPVAINP